MHFWAKRLNAEQLWALLGGNTDLGWVGGVGVVVARGEGSDCRI